MDLGGLIERIESVIEETQADVDEAVNSFSAPARVATWDEFHEVIARFYRHVENEVLRISMDCDVSFDRSNADRVLAGVFGHARVAFDLARSGQEGGMFKVLRTLAQGMAEAYSEREIGARVADFLDGLSFDEERAVAREYIERYGHLVSSELMEGSPAYVQANLQRVLAGHPRIVQRVRGATRGY